MNAILLTFILVTLFLPSRTGRLYALFFLLCSFCGIAQRSGYNVRVHKGNEAFDKKELPAAIAKYNEALKFDSLDFAAHYNLGNALYREKEYSEAQRAYKKAESLAKNKEDKKAVLYNRGNAYMKSLDFDNASEFYKKALTLDPYNEEILKNYQISKYRRKNQAKKNRGVNQKNSKKEEGNKGTKTDQDQERNQDQKKDSPKEGDKPKEIGDFQGEGEQDKGEQKGNKRSGGRESDPDGRLLKEIQTRESNTAKRILNRNAYFTPRSKEKDW
ncbi:MAG: tetratricopeptide repeat protein [Bergeyella sp.]|nr:tetratricopeptide repeat protein [Bergeyella sp.]